MALRSVGVMLWNRSHGITCSSVLGCRGVYLGPHYTFESGEGKSSRLACAIWRDIRGGN